jgi:nucleoside-diphosphate-sugar epimerase
MISGKKILITGATGQVARPVAEALAVSNEVWCIGRFLDSRARAALEAQGMRTSTWDMGADELHGLPDDFTHVLHAAVLRDTDDFEAAIRVNTVGTGTLMTHCRNAEAFLFVSAFAVYKFIAPDHAYAETDPLGGHTPWMPAYAPAKISTEGAVRALARTLRLPTAIARLNTAYGPRGHGGVPVRFFRLMRAGEPIAVPRAGDDWQSPIHTDDLARQTPLLWDAAAVDPAIVNWAGDETISVRDMMDYISALTGVPVRYQPSDVTRATFVSDNTRRRALIGDCSVSWREGIPKTMEAHFPGAVTHPDAASRHT